METLKRRHWSRLLVELLEDRTAPAILTVAALGDANTGAGNAGDIRYCLGKAGLGDVINFDATLFATPQIITVTSQLVVGNNITINGPGFNGAGLPLATIKNIAAVSSTSRVLEVNLGLNVSLSGLTFTGGALPAGSRGAGIESLAASLTLTNCVITGNSTAEDGGGISVSQDSCKLTLIDCSVTGNHATGVSSDGGGIYLATYTNLTLKESTIAGNDAAHNGAGLYFFYGGTYSIENCTITGNSTLGKGGAIYFFGNPSATPTLRNSTITGNTASFGGGLYFNNISAVSASSSIIAKNFGVPADISGAVTVSGDNNLIYSLAGGFTLSGSGNITGLDPMLAPLANNGGVTQTCALQAGSPAIDAGNNVGGMSFDQRGTGFARVQGAKADIGAYEMASSAPSAAMTSLGPIVAAGASPNTVQITYTDAAAIDVTSIDKSDIQIVAPNLAALTVTAVAVDINANGTPRVATYTFTPLGGAWDASDNGAYQVRIVANQVANTSGAPQFVPAGVLSSFQVMIPTTYMVDEPTDTDDANYTSGHLSFREALKLANASQSTNDTIAFSSSVFNSATTITQTAGEYAVADAVTINGPGSGKLTLDANKLSRHFNIDVPGSSGNAVSITGMTLTKGYANGANGGSIFNNDEQLSLSNVVLVKNTSTLNGGAIAIAKTEASLNISDSTLNQNASIAPANTITGGGAIFVLGHSSVSISRSTISGNVSTNLAGGVYMFNAGTFLVQDSTLSNNTANDNGGAINLWTTTAIIVNSTIVTNRSVSGGAIGLSSIANLTINNSTIAGNTAISSGGGISIANGSATLTLSSTIVAGNINAAVADIATPGSFGINGGNNLIGVADQGGFVLGGTNKTGTQAVPLDPLLGPLTNNGGSTFTAGLLPGSPAIDSGADNSLSFDQRGSGFARKIGASADVGAFEGSVAYPIAKLDAFGPVVTTGPTPNSLTITYSDNTGINVGSIGVSDITILDPAQNKLTITGANANLITNGTPRTVTYTFTPPGGSWDVSDNGTYTVQINVNEVFDTDALPFSVPAGILGIFRVAVANNYIVDEATDLDDGNFSVGHLSLREAIKLANTSNMGVADLITFDPAVFKAGTNVTLSGNELTITDPLTIIGPGIANLTVDGSALSRIFSINLANNRDTVSLSNLTMSDGMVTDANGGAILNNNAALTLTQTNVIGNKATSNTSNAKGGGISLVDSAASLTLIDCTISNNQATGVASTGGGIYIADNSTVTIQRTTISGNQAGEDGGGIYFNNSGTLTMLDSTMSGNKSNLEAAGSGGGGLYLFGTTATIRNSTIASNTTSSAGFVGNGGGIAVLSNSFLTIQNSTIAFNTAIASSGGGLFLATGTTVSSESTVVAKNVASLGVDIAGQLIAKNSLIGDNSGSTLLAGSASNIVDVDPLLAPLASDGGLTQTLALLSGSPAVGAGSNPAGLTFDQRGSGFARQIGSAVDIGAVEQSPPRVTSVIINGGALQRSRVISVAVAFDQHVSLPSPAANAFQLKRQSDGMGVSLGASVDDSGSGTVATLSFTGGAVDGPSLADGRYTLTVFAGQVANTNGTLDGNVNGSSQGSPTDDYVFASAHSPNQATNLFRVFGDGDGNGLIDGIDFGSFRAAFGTSNIIFDFDNSGVVDGFDFGQFRNRFGKTI